MGYNSGGFSGESIVLCHPKWDNVETIIPKQYGHIKIHLYLIEKRKDIVVIK